jgi:hypothetical protein
MEVSNPALDQVNAGAGPGPSEGGPDLEGQGQGQKIWLRSSPDGHLPILGRGT